MRGKDFAMKLIKKYSLKLPICQIQTVLSDPKHRVKGGKKLMTEVTLTSEESLENEKFARIVQEMELAEGNNDYLSNHLK